MRFVKAPKRSVGSATTKGHYRNKFGRETHHRRKSETPVKFVGVDGEGVKGPLGDHRYVLFGVGDAQLENPDGLQWWEVFGFLYRFYKPATAYVGFYLGYDFTQILRSLPEERARILLTSEGIALRRHRIKGKPPHPVEAKAPDGQRWHFDMLGNKRLRIRPKSCECENATCEHTHKPWMYVCDVGGYFQTSFLKAINPEEWAEGTAVVTPEEYNLIRVGKERRSNAQLDNEMRMYNQLENAILARLMATIDVGLHAIGIHLSPSKWFGPGQAAQEWMKNAGVPTGETCRQHVPAWFMEAARMAYFGGWFEIFMHGIIPGESHEYDINSAYPQAIRRLPCLLHGNYSKGEGIPRGIKRDSKGSTGRGHLCLVYGRIESPGMPTQSSGNHIGVALHRDSHGRILRPRATVGWFWWDELKAAERAGLIKKLRATPRTPPKGRPPQGIERWVNYEPCECSPPLEGVADLYQRRLDVGKKTPLGKVAKLIYNSMYGKFAQSVGEPIFGNSIYASRITSCCRTQILDAIATHPKGTAHVAMVATDGIYFISPHDSLAISGTLGEWDHNVRSNLTLFKPGVYWDDSTRREILQGESVHFKARGFNARDFANAIGRIDSHFAAWADSRAGGNPAGGYPSTSFVPRFAMVSALQALRRNKWELAGSVANEPKALVQDSNPSDKRCGFYGDMVDGRRVFRSRPHYGLRDTGETLEWIPSVPYEKRFGMEDPWSDEYREQFGITPDGTVGDILTWILMGEK